MREPSTDHALFGLLAEFDTPERLRDSVGEARKAGFERLDAYSPFPIEGMDRQLDIKDGRLSWLTLVGGMTGAALGYGMQVYTNYAYPINVGARPLMPWQAFMLITFELTILFAVLAAILGMLILNRLPRLNHPLFDVPDFHLASANRFFLVIFANDPHFDERETHAFLERLAPLRVETVGHAEVST